MGKAAVELLERGLIVLGVDDLACLAWALGLWCDNAGWRDTTSLWNVLRSAAGVAGGLGGSSGRLGRDIDDVELAAGGGLSGVVLGGVVGDVVAVDDIVVPVSLALLQSSTLEFEAADPTASLLGVLAKRKLTLIAIPGTEKVDGLAVGRSAESKVKLNSGHCS